MTSNVSACAIAKCDYCGKDCSIFTSKSGSHVGRKFFKCSLNCLFFMWVDHLKMCECGNGQCKVRTAKTSANYGRYFWCCPQSTGVGNKGCGMFEWILDSSLSCHTYQTPPRSLCSETSSSSSPSPSSDYIKGYLNGAIKESEGHTRMLRDVLDTVKKLDLNKNVG
ncbi:uncharacterized protein LOC122087700 [Macadamia integrifolia]|uniref:uncharacterized protein LOC122087700 n=1 Tax=Macadamia integrifolia TaxID=60698 RepID=UPI001C4F6C76|nr:uncharacterized protein LOC122087700 [Macadamia integrifolia]